MIFQFSKHEFESAMYRNLPYGAESEIARRVDKSSSIISQMYNPDDERESNLVKAARELSASFDIDQAFGRKQLSTFLHFVHRHNEPTELLDVDTERRLWHKERMEADLAELEGKPLLEQIRELEENHAQLARVIEAKRALVLK